tara:strand:+ start:174 stop:470 length:297 start_codon:yes stop_codon:yes gene_type:complete
MTETSKMTAQEYTNHLKFVEFARKEQEIYGHTGLEPSECPQSLLAADLEFNKLSPAQRRNRRWLGVIDAAPSERTKTYLSRFPMEAETDKNEQDDVPV